MDIENAKSHRVRSHYTATGYKLDASQIWYPTDVEILNTTETGRVYSIEHYHLITANLNEAADLAALKQVVPKGVILNDFRFGDQNGIRYRVAQHFPSDAEVQALAAKQKQAFDQQRKAEQ